MSDHLSPPPPEPPIPSPSLPPVPGAQQFPASQFPAGQFPAGQSAYAGPATYPGQQTYPGPAAYLGAPVPPRSRAGSHIVGVLLALVLGPLAFLLLAFGNARSREVFQMSMFVSSGAAFFYAGAAIAVGIIAWWNFRSSAGSITLAILWGGSGVLTLISSDLNRTIADALGSFLPYEAEMAVIRVLHQQMPLLAAACLAGSAGAASIARRRGRGDERSGGIAATAGGVPVAPRSRVFAHIGSSVGSAVLAAFAWAAAASYIRSFFDMRPAWLALIVAVVALALIPLLGSWSSLGPAIAGGLWLGATIAIFTMNSPNMGFLDLLALVSSWIGQDQSSLEMIRPALEGLTSLISGMLLGSALGTHFARRDGRAIERSERRLTAST